MDHINKLDSKNTNQKSNFNIGNKTNVQNQFLSMQKQAMESVKNRSKSGMKFQSG